MKMRFNPPPNWPVPPDWSPGPDRRPDPSWPLPPPGWEWWVPDSSADADTEVQRPTVPHHPVAPSPAPEPTALLETAVQALASGDTSSARAAAEEAVQMLRHRVTTEPGIAANRVALARALEVSSEIALEGDELRRAADTAEEAVRLRLAMVDADPRDIETLLALGVAYNNLGTVALAHCDGDEAIRWMQVSCQVFRDVLAMRPNAVEAHRNLGEAAHRLGQVAAADEQNALARAAFEQSVTARRHLALSPQDHAEWHQLGESLIGLCEAQNELADDSAALGSAQEAVNAFRNAVVDQGDVQAHRDLTLALVKSAACAANGNDPQTTAVQALEAASVWQRYGTEASGRRWPVIAALLTRCAPALERGDAQLAQACRRTAQDMS